MASRGGTVVLEDGVVAADLFVDGERISAIALPGTAGEARAMLDATGCCVMPGAIDAHVHVHIPYVRPDDSTPYAAVPPYSSVDYSIYEGLPGLYPRAVLARGRLLARDGVYVGPHGGGRFVPGTPARQ